MRLCIQNICITLGHHTYMFIAHHRALFCRLAYIGLVLFSERLILCVLQHIYPNACFLRAVGSCPKIHYRTCCDLGGLRVGVYCKQGWRCCRLHRYRSNPTYSSLIHRYSSTTGCADIDQSTDVCRGDVSNIRTFTLESSTVTNVEVVRRLSDCACPRAGDRMPQKFGFSCTRQYNNVVRMQLYRCLSTTSYGSPRVRCSRFFFFFSKLF